MATRPSSAKFGKSRWKTALQYSILVFVLFFIHSFIHACMQPAAVVFLVAFVFMTHGGSTRVRIWSKYCQRSGTRVLDPPSAIDIILTVRYEASFFMWWDEHSH